MARAERMARTILRRNSMTIRLAGQARGRRVLVAGADKFQDAWTRDFSFGALGLLAIGTPEATRTVRDHLDMLLDRQFSDGLIPRRIGEGSMKKVSLLRMVRGRRPAPRVFDTRDRKGGFGGLSVDSNLLVPIVAAEYASRAAGGREFAIRRYDALARTLEWVPQKDGLAVQRQTSDWKDLVKRGTMTMYNQALYYQALRGMAEMASSLGRHEDAARYLRRSEVVVREVNARFWQAGTRGEPGYFHDSESSAQFSPDGNLLAVYFGLADPAQTRDILARSRTLLEREHLLPALDGRYSFRQIPLAARASGMARYQDAFKWPWITSLYAMAAARAGDRPKAEHALRAVADAANQQGTFFEVHEGKDLRPAHRPLHRSEPGFTWSAGLFVRASEELRRLPH